VDVQNDFLPGGALAVPGGDEVIPVINRIAGRFDLVVATQDWHPPDHGSFAGSHPGRRVGEAIDLNGLEQVLWPVHCVAGTPGAALAAALDTSGVEKVFHKGTDAGIDSYSAMYDNAHRKSTGLAEFLRGRGVTDAYIAGLATDYCVKFTALDAAAEGFEVFVIADACRGVDLHPGDVAKAVEEMKSAGVRVVTSAELPAAAGGET
jgi:nicotinamidase/pyrazinamidase